MKTKQQEGAQQAKKANPSATQDKWHDMNRKQRREMMRKMQSEDLSLEVIHPDAAGIDIGNESHYVAVPPSRDSQPLGLFRPKLPGEVRKVIFNVFAKFPIKQLEPGVVHKGFPLDVQEFTKQVEDELRRLGFKVDCWTH